jgi:hypothetical protein
MRDPPEIAAILPLVVECDEAALRVRAEAIAGREAAGEGGFVPVRAGLVELYGTGSDRSLLGRLAADIRAGRFDRPGPERSRIERLLWSLAIAKLGENNPDFLCHGHFLTKM